MKKPLRSVVVEYKGGRRTRKMNKPNALWGNIDLKAIAEDVQEDISLPGNKTAFGANTRDNAAVPMEEEAASQVPAAPPPPSPVASAPRILETISTPSPEVLPTTPTRSDREDTAKSSSPPIQSGKQTSSREERLVPKRRRKSAAPRPVNKAEPQQPATTLFTPLATTVSIGDEIEALEAENAALKRQLMEKLRSENAQLAKMLMRFSQRRQS